MSDKKYASLNTLKIFLDNLKNTFSALSHAHTAEDVGAMPITGGTFQGSVYFTSSNELPQKNLQYVIGLDPFTSGGQLGWMEKKNLLADCATKNEVASALKLVEREGKFPIELSTTDSWYSIIHNGNGRYVALVNGSTSAAAAYSDDGYTWTQTEVPAVARWQGGVYSNGVFVAAGGISGVIYSTDEGVTWNKATLPVSGNWREPCFGNGKFVICAYGSDKIIYSEDGINWLATTAPYSAQWYSMTYSDENKRFVMVSGNNGYFAYSTDAITWTGENMPSIDSAVGSWRYIVCNENNFIALTQKGDGIVTSNLGTVWNTTIYTMPDTTITWNKPVYGNGLWVATSTSTSGIGAYSSDGKNWTQIKMPSSSQYYAPMFDGEKFMCTKAKSDEVVYSINGKIWQEGSIYSLQTLDGADVTSKVIKAFGL